jgi:uncharacterized membrane protein
MTPQRPLTKKEIRKKYQKERKEPFWYPIAFVALLVFWLCVSILGVMVMLLFFGGVERL